MRVIALPMVLELLPQGLCTDGPPRNLKNFLFSIDAWRETGLSCLTSA
jgi:hypothetical protein